MARLAIVLQLALLAMLAAPAFGAIEERQFDSPEQQERFERLSAELRCPKCLNTNLAGSDAPIANDLRQELYEQIRAGRSDDEIVEFMTARYGDFILYRPPLRPGTYVLWFGPLVLLVLGFFIIGRTLSRKRAAEGDDHLSAEEDRKLQNLLSPESDK